VDGTFGPTRFLSHISTSAGMAGGSLAEYNGGAQPAEPPTVAETYMLHELFHSLRIRGQRDWAVVLPPYNNSEEFFAVVVTHIYRSRGLSLEIL